MVNHAQVEGLKTQVADLESSLREVKNTAAPLVEVSLHASRSHRSQGVVGADLITGSCSGQAWSCTGRRERHTVAVTELERSHSSRVAASLLSTQKACADCRLRIEHLFHGSTCFYVLQKLAALAPRVDNTERALKEVEEEAAAGLEEANKKVPA
jgi:hypothetical protein